MTPQRFRVVPGSMRLMPPGKCRRLMRAITQGNRPDPHTPAQRAAIERKRRANNERDRRRFIAAMAGLPDSAFGTIAKPPEYQRLIAGLGRLRRARLFDLWHGEPRRRAARTAHQVFAERRLYGRLWIAALGSILLVNLGSKRVKSGPRLEPRFRVCC